MVRCGEWSEVPFATDAPQKNGFFASAYIQNKAALRELRDCEA
jgi:hypothetical protein